MTAEPDRSASTPSTGCPAVVDHPVSRRLFLAVLGRGSAALLVMGVAACAPGRSSPAPSSVASPSGAIATGPSASAPGAGGPPSPSDGTNGSAAGVAWRQVNLGFVSAYVLARQGEAAVVDTGVAGSERDIEAALAALGLGWDAVGHVVLTHRHPDHIGSAAAVLDLAPGATGYAGAEDIPAITVPRPLEALADGDDVFGLLAIATPGHTPGHVSVLDPIGGILVAGDALTASGGKATGPDPQFTPDMTTAMASVAKLATLRFDTLLVGHGDPIESGADVMVRALAAG